MSTPRDVRLDAVRAAPADGGRVELIARRPAHGEREVLAVAELDVALGLVGDRWSAKGPRANPKSQVTLMGARAAALLAGERDRWPLAGDQLYVDLDLSEANVPPGTRLAVGTAILEVTDHPHRGCVKFSARFGEDARALASSAEGIALNLRGVNTRVVQSGTVRTGDLVRKLPL